MNFVRLGMQILAIIIVMVSDNALPILTQMDVIINKSILIICALMIQTLLLNPTSTKLKKLLDLQVDALKVIS